MSGHTYIEDGPDLRRSTSPISQAVVAGDHCYVSGQLSVDRDGVFRDGTTLDEAKRSFLNVFAAVRASGFSESDLVFVDIAFIDLNDVPIVNALWEQLFPIERRPARTIYQAAALPFGGRIKVQAIAVRQR